MSVHIMKTNPEVEQAIDAELAAWASLSNEDRRQRAIMKQREEAQRVEADLQKAAESARLTSELFDSAVEAFKRMAASAKVMTPEQEADHNWQTRIAPQLKSLGLEDRHIERIAPNWNCEPQRKTFERVRDLCQCTGAVVAMVGNRGTGKTTIAAQLMRERVEASWARWLDPSQPTPIDAGRYAKLQRLAAHFKPLYADFGSPNSEILADRLTSWCRLDLLVLDEIHESEDIKTQMRLLVDLVDRRYAARKDTILISNRSHEQFIAEINPSILSRIGEHGQIIPCMWESWRAKK